MASSQKSTNRKVKEKRMLLFLRSQWVNKVDGLRNDEKLPGRQSDAHMVSTVWMTLCLSSEIQGKKKLPASFINISGLATPWVISGWNREIWSSNRYSSVDSTPAAPLDAHIVRVQLPSDGISSINPKREGALYYWLLPYTAVPLTSRMDK